MPKLGTINLHASLLPNYRGAAPINWAIINGEDKTGVTTFFIDDKIDTGAMILHSELKIFETENAGHLHDRLMELGSQTVIETIKLIEKGNVKTKIQEELNQIKTAYKLDKNNSKIDWSKKTIEIFNLIRGLSPYPTSWCHFKNNNQILDIKIYEAKMVLENHTEILGKVFVTKNEMKIATIDGFIIILNLQFPGKKKMNTSELINGIQFSENAMVC